MLQSFHHYFGITVKIRKNQIFHCFFYFWPWSRNNYVMNSMPWYFPVNFTPKNYTSKFNLRKKNFRFPKGVSGSISKLINDHFVMSAGIFFFVEKKLIIVFFGVKFTGDYHNVAVIPTLFRDHRQKSKKPIFSLFFLLLTVITK